MLYLGFARKRVKRLYLFSNVSACNITLCREQHVAREIRVDRAWCNLRTDVIWTYLYENLNFSLFSGVDSYTLWAMTGTVQSPRTGLSHQNGIWLTSNGDSQWCSWEQTYCVASLATEVHQKRSRKHSKTAALQTCLGQVITAQDEGQVLLTTDKQVCQTSAVTYTSSDTDSVPSLVM